MNTAFSGYGVPRGVLAATAVIFMVCAGLLGAQDIDFELSENLEAPRFDASFSMGFNYDLLRFPTDISFERPVGYAGFNMPLNKTVDILDVARLYSEPVDSIFADTMLFSNGEEFQPTATAAQNPNTTFRVEVPMLRGAARFANIENFHLSYNNTLGVPEAMLSETLEDEGISLLARGAVYTPLSVSASWKTMAFGYAYRINRQLVVSFELYRHLFTFDANASVSTDLLGYADIDQEQLDMRLPIEYSLGGFLTASYTAESVTPALSLKWWRLGMVARFGFSTNAKGDMKVKYSVPFFIDPYTFESNIEQDDLTDPSYINKIKENQINTFTTDSAVEGNSITWEMPSGYTFSFDLLKDNIRLSWTKIDGDVHMQRDNIWINEAQSSGDASIAPDTIDFDLRVSVDNVIMCNIRLFDAFLNAGVFSFDISYGESKKLLATALEESMGEDAGTIMLGGNPMVPVLNLGTAVGSRIQLLMELDLLPFPAAKTGVRYYF